MQGACSARSPANASNMQMVKLYTHMRFGGVTKKVHGSMWKYPRDSIVTAIGSSRPVRELSETIGELIHLSDGGVHTLHPGITGYW